MKNTATRLLPLLAATALLGACEVSYKAQDDAMYYTDRAIGQYHKIENFARSRFDRDYVAPENIQLHLSNFDTFVCDGERQFVANFDREEKTVSTIFNGKNKFLTRTDTYYPFTDGIYDLFVMDNGTLLIQKDGTTIFQHCRPLIADTQRAGLYRGGAKEIDPVYTYTPTMSPADYRAYDTQFDKAMSK